MNTAPFIDTGVCALEQSVFGSNSRTWGRLAVIHKKVCNAPPL